MTEEIIIDGIDVSGCCLYKDGICLTDKGKCTSMCDYGAYAREEELKKLEQENAKLKEENFKLGQIDIKKVTLVGNRQLEEENKKLKEQLETLQDEIGHLQQVLLQIKDIAMCGDCEHDCDHCMQGVIHKLVDKAVGDEK